MLLTVAVFFYIFKPVRAEHAAEKTRLAFLYERKEQIFENLRDLNFEYKAGKLSDADFSTSAMPWSRRRKHSRRD